MIQTTFNKEDMIYPSTSCAPVVYTEFVNGIRFDVCEVIPQCFEYLCDKKYRFFLSVEDMHIISYSAAEKWFEHSGDTRWDFFCSTIGDVKSWIKDYEKTYDQVKRWNELVMQKPGIKPMILPKISAANQYCLNRFGVKAA